ncbi:MAG: alkaline phosphatase, partial [Daejeonella sp.]|nr:alkaline phosphatase [Daejeonella sp.]
TILKSIKEAGIEKNTVVLFTADHGGVNKGHGLISMNEMQIPWIMRGPGIQRNRELTESIMTFDTAATIAKLLKLKVPQAWIGRPVKGAFNK